VKISKQSRRGAKELFLACRRDGMLDEAKVRELVQKVIQTKPRGYLPILSHFVRLVKLDVERRTARIESPVPLSDAEQAEIKGNLGRRYGEGLSYVFTQNPKLLGGLRVQVGSDVYDGSVQARLEELAAGL
jgi:F-type H+-transporting ATPase subunit delta